MSCDPKCQRRRDFIKHGIQTVSSGALTLCTMRLLSACGQSPLTQATATAATSAPAGTVTTASGDPANTYTFLFADNASLQNTGGSVSATVNASSGTKNLYVTRVTSTSAIAVTTTCTHSGCTINAYSSGPMTYTCPCHSSVFNADGTVNTGPAGTALTSYTGTITGTGIKFTIP